eukprot:CAMPEP_0172817252 /NCGR_PEP_ID=MMETSP1075-20121228/13068_1 /TAXON_ID=2916 /ORGANISM="Ceratium fusus, Strain PA161109" /LENGTH=57 /DNA_ID=CAMNT_0013657405 /DNA_START=109 /DNA_END=280 /DNA_ORIENTATION=+
MTCWLSGQVRRKRSSEIWTDAKNTKTSMKPPKKGHSLARVTRVTGLGVVTAGSGRLH